MEVTGPKNGRTVSKRKPASDRGAGGLKPSVLKLIKELKEHKVQSFKGDGVEVLFSPYAFLPEAEKDPMSRKEEDNEELLFYSAPPRE